MSVPRAPEAYVPESASHVQLSFPQRQSEPRMSRGSTDADWLSPRVRTTGIELKLNVGETLFRAGQQTLDLYEILSGRVELVRVDRSGRETVLHNANAGDTLAEASLFSPTYIAMR
jgi:CRP-like cAMP-binding protein